MTGDVIEGWTVPPPMACLLCHTRPRFISPATLPGGVLFHCVHEAGKPHRAAHRKGSVGLRVKSGLLGLGTPCCSWPL